MPSGSRVLHLDGVPNTGVALPRLVESKEDIERLYTEEFCLVHTKDLVLDVRSLSQANFNLLLKFLEEFTGGITLVAYDPIPPAILSRFSIIEKHFSPPDKRSHLLALRFKHLPYSIRGKVFNTFNIAQDDEPL